MSRQVCEGMRLFLILILCSTSLQSCNRTEPDILSGDSGERWYATAQVTAGALVFQQHCALCHGERAQGLVGDWRQKLEDGSFPPPPLDGTAHAWHHPLSVLLQVINQGGAEFGGKMPPFAGVLSDDEKMSAIAYFQSYWSDEIYAQWLQMGGTN